MFDKNSAFARAFPNLSISSSIASTCEKDDLINAGGDFGAMLYEQARRSPREMATLLQREGFKKVVAQDLI